MRFNPRTFRDILEEFKEWKVEEDGPLPISPETEEAYLTLVVHQKQKVWGENGFSWFSTVTDANTAKKYASQFPVLENFSPQKIDFDVSLEKQIFQFVEQNNLLHALITWPRPLHLTIYAPPRKLSPHQALLAAKQNVQTGFRKNGYSSLITGKAAIYAYAGFLFYSCPSLSGKAAIAAGSCCLAGAMHGHPLYEETTKNTHVASWYKVTDQLDSSVRCPLRVVLTNASTLPELNVAFGSSDLNFLTGRVTTLTDCAGETQARELQEFLGGLVAGEVQDDPLEDRALEDV
jgi:hypothetical protein